MACPEPLQDESRLLDREVSQLPHWKWWLIGGFGLFGLLFAWWVVIPAWRIERKVSAAQAASSSDVVWIQRERPQWLAKIIGDRVTYLPLLDRVTAVVLAKDTVQDSTVEILRWMPDVASLNLRSGAITDQSIQEVGRLKGLVELRMSPGSHVTTEGLSELSGCVSLTELWIDGSYARNLKWPPGRSLPSLRWLTLQSLDITSEGIGDSRDFQSLVKLEIRGSRISGEALRSIGALTSLTELRLYDCTIHETDLTALSPLENLQELKVHESSFEDGPTGLPHLARLRWLDLSGSLVDDRTLAGVVHLPNLRTLYLNSTLVSDTGLEHLAVHPRLQSIELKGTAVTTDGMRHLARMPRLLSVNVEMTEVDDLGLGVLAQSDTLESIVLYPRRCTFADVEAFLEAHPRFRKLSQLRQ